MYQHMSTVYRDGDFPCDQCNMVFSKKGQSKTTQKRHCKKNSEASATTISAKFFAGLSEE